jgi:hypothetical protein
MCAACGWRGRRTISRGRLFPLAVALLAACAGATSQAPSLPETQRQVETYIDSGRYLKDFEQVVSRAQAWMQQQASSAARPAIVLDIDETSLSNWPAYRTNGWGRVVNGPCDLEKGPFGLRAWQATGQSKALAPTLAKGPSSPVRWSSRRRSGSGSRSGAPPSCSPW